MKKTIAKVMAFTTLAATPVDCGRSNFVNTGSTAAPGKTQTEGAASEAAETKEEGAGAASYKFAFLPNTQNSTFQAAMNDMFKKLCDEKGYGYVRLDLGYDLNIQLSQMADVATQNFDAVFVIPIDSAEIRQGLEQIHEENIPILSANTPVIDDDLDLAETVIATDACNTGTLAGQQMVVNYPDGAKIAILDFLSSESCVNRVAGFFDGLGDVKDKSDIVAQQDGAAILDISMPTAENIIRVSPDSDAPFCINNSPAPDAAAAIKASDKTGIDVYSTDAFPDGKVATLDGPFTAVAAQIPIGIAEIAFEKAGEFLTGDETEKETLLPFFLIDEKKAEATLKDRQ